MIPTRRTSDGFDAIVLGGALGATQPATHLAFLNDPPSGTHDFAFEQLGQVRSSVQALRALVVSRDRGRLVDISLSHPSRYPRSRSVNRSAL